MSSPEQPDIVLTARDHDLKIRELDAHLVSDKSRRTIGMGILVLIGIAFVAGTSGMVIDGIYKAPTDPIERVLMPTVTGLIGVLGGLFVSGGNSR